MNTERLEQFTTVYGLALRRAIEEYPDEYLYSIEYVPGVVTRMRVAIEEGTYHHAGRVFKATCKQLGVKHTRKAIEAFLERNLR
jgi:hypothetical protein